MKTTYELLAPAGNFTNLRAAIDGGADAIYFGVKEFNMRALAKNFEFSDLKKIKQICDKESPLKKRVKMYVTLNIIVYDNELAKLESTIKKIKPYVDAVICWDMAVIQLCKKHKVPFHISTQASTANSATAKYFKELGAERIVLARELNLEQVKAIHDKVKIEIECFCHGAMCLSISGRCLMSQFHHKKSANRGECIQNCRRPYTIKDDQGHEMKIENNHILSAKDLCTLPFIEEMKKAGITSFKIEGRNRDPRYVKTVTSIYRKALDKKMSDKEIEDSVCELEKVYNKGLSSGFYKGFPTSDDFSKVQHSAATEKKVFTGKVKNFLTKLGVCIVVLSGEVKQGNKIVIIGQTTGVHETTLKKIEMKGQEIESAQKGDEVALLFENLPKDGRIRKNDEVYVLINVEKK
ncbi:protease [Candidatus Pacearchaeota archaeon CG10_big_fil_rev_8_21_14_0_10_32_14]|nr:MAG: protease [Candidatus Pacearchaeota archaeon CG10_big_fil_rev_8_21_14_0_10_32_14]